MKVSRIRSPSTTSVRKKEKARATGGVSFSEHLKKSGDSESSVRSVAESSAISPVGAIIAAQEYHEEDGEGARAQLRRRGEDILDRLDEIRHDLLIGAIPAERLTNLAGLLRQRRAAVTDERLVKIIDEIELRAEVEIAKLARGT